MKYSSSRDQNNKKDGLMSVIEGLSSEGGLYTPNLKEVPSLKIEDYIDLSYQDCAKKIVSIYFDELNKQEIDEIIDQAYDCKFDTKDIVGLRKCNDEYFLELYHGPTCAFKDMALTVLPRLLKAAYKKNKIDKKIYILTATSGDTGKAALEGFKDVQDTYISVFFPKDKVSKIQEKQMLTSLGKNTDVIQVEGNFDDCQKIVKDLLVSKELNHDQFIYSSANSINIGRLILQIVYYIYAYKELLRTNQINKNEEISFSVPCGNFGNILAGYIAKQMGLPIKHLICASNHNDVLTEFIQTGHYNKKREFYKTISPSMDILVSSNVERLLYILSDYDSNLMKEYMNDLNTKGEYQVSDSILKKIQETFVAYSFNDEQTKNGIKEIYELNHHLIDPHTAVAYLASREYRLKNKEKMVVVSTASPYKFAKDVYHSIFDNEEKDEFICQKKCEEINDEKIPESIKDLDKKEIKHHTIIKPNEAIEVIAKRFQND